MIGAYAAVATMLHCYTVTLVLRSGGQLSQLRAHTQSLVHAIPSKYTQTLLPRESSSQ